MLLLNTSLTFALALFSLSFSAQAASLHPPSQLTVLQRQILGLDGRTIRTIDAPATAVDELELPDYELRRSPDPSPAVRVTNAQRMIAGLAPLPPRRRGSRTSHAARSVPSSSPIYGYILAKREGTNTFYGYMARKPWGDGTVTNPTPSTALRLILPPAADRTAPFNLAVDAANPGYPYLGLADSIGDLKQYYTNNMMFARVSETQPNATPAYGANVLSDDWKFDLYIESAIWSYNELTGQLNPKWVNKDQSIPQIFYGIITNEGGWIAVYDKQNFEQVTGADVVWLDLYFVTEASLTSTGPTYE